MQVYTFLSFLVQVFHSVSFLMQVYTFLSFLVQVFHSVSFLVQVFSLQRKKVLIKIELTSVSPSASKIYKFP